MITIILALFLPSVLWRCWLGVRKAIRPVKKLSGGVPLLCACVSSVTCTVTANVKTYFCHCWDLEGKSDPSCQHRINVHMGTHLLIVPTHFHTVSLPPPGCSEMQTVGLFVCLLATLRKISEWNCTKIFYGKFAVGQWTNDYILVMIRNNVGFRTFSRMSVNSTDKQTNSLHSLRSFYSPHRATAQSWSSIGIGTAFHCIH